MTPDEIARRLALHACLRCALPGLGIDAATGFYEQYCADCRLQLAAEAILERRRIGESHVKRAKRMRDEGVELLRKLGA